MKRRDFPISWRVYCKSDTVIVATTLQKSAMAPSGLILLVATVVVLHSCIADDECGPNRVYNSCGSACPAMCSNRHLKNQACPAVCRSGCQCEPGLYLKDDGTCVPSNAC